jgi:hypothetical protein
MSSRILVALAVLLIAAIIWIGLRGTGDSRSPLAAPEPAPASSARIQTELELPTTPSVDPNAPVELASKSVVAQENVNSRANANETIVLFGTVFRPPNADTTDEETYVGVTDHLGTRAGTKASAEGAYSISGIAPGHCWVDAESSPPASAASRAHAELDLPLADSPKRFDIVLEATPAILVKVVDRDGTPLLTPGLLAVATRADPGDWFDRMTDDSLSSIDSFRDGRYTGGPFPDGFIGRILLKEPPPVLVSLLYSQRVLETRRVERGQTQIVFTVDASTVETSTVRVRLVDEHGVAPTNALVNLEGDTPGSMLPDGDGWVAKYLMPGKYTLRPRARGLEMRSVPVVVTPGTDMDLGTIVLAPEQSISGKVRVTGDEDRSGAWLHCEECTADGSTNPSRMRYMLPIQADGSFVARTCCKSSNASGSSAPGRASSTRAAAPSRTSTSSSRKVFRSSCDRRRRPTGVSASAFSMVSACRSCPAVSGRTARPRFLWLRASTTSRSSGARSLAST